MTTTFKRTKILATIGPATDSYAQIKAMIEAGVNGFRLNFSHESFEAADQHIAWIRQASEALEKPVAILQDLQGPKVRLGAFEGSIPISVGDEITLDYGLSAPNGLHVPSQFNLAEKVKVGEPLYIFDGKIRCVVKSIDSATAITVTAQTGGELMSKKGINLPDTDFGGDIITEKDQSDIEYGYDKDIDYVALSFVQSADDIQALRAMLIANGSQAHIIAKIETKAAIQPAVLEAIVEASDGVMVARGDLAVEVGPEVVPIMQRKIIALCRQYGKLSIVATQMMASMVTQAEPTRAEVSDIASAVILGADTVMLSDETAMGNFPLEAIASMKRVIMYTQEHAPPAPLSDVLVSQHTTPQTAIASAAVQLAEQLEVTALVAETRSGATANNIAAFRPNLPIISVTSEPRTAQQLALAYATKSFVREDGEKAGLTLAKELTLSNYLNARVAPVNVVIVSGRQPGLTGGTDTIRVRCISA